MRPLKARLACHCLAATRGMTAEHKRTDGSAPWSRLLLQASDDKVWDMADSAADLIKIDLPERSSVRSSGLVPGAPRHK